MVIVSGLPLLLPIDHRRTLLAASLDDPDDARYTVTAGFAWASARPDSCLIVPEGSAMRSSL
jgi:hypothetical protein